jgi:hypothetical protein
MVRQNRANQRGAAVFIVVLAITLLTAIGVFAVRTATLVSSAAGYDRQSVQSHYVSEYAGRMSASYSTDLVEDISARLTNRDPSKWDNCVATRNQSMPCVKFYKQEMGANPFYTGLSMFESQTTTSEGSFGPKLGAANTGMQIDAQLLAELTEPFDLETVKGFQAGGGATYVNVQVTVTAISQIRSVPVGAPPVAWCSALNSSTGANAQQLRVLMTIPNKHTY